MSLLKAAAAKSAAKPAATKKTKATVWTTDNAEAQAVAKAVHEVTVLHGEIKAIETKMDIAKKVIKKFCLGRFYKDYAQMGVFPETPMTVVNSDGDKATFVVQDRSASSAVKPEQVEELADILGEDRANELLVSETTFSFNRDVLLREGVADVIDKALERVQNQLRDKNLLGEDEDLLTASQKTVFVPGTLERLAIICGRDTTRMEAVVGAMGSAAVMYVKA